MTSKKTSGIGVLGILQIVFLLLKLTNNIDWNWLWVLSPILFPILLFLVSVVTLTVVIFIGVGLGIWDLDRINDKIKSRDAGKE